jgi:hypothetical protein
MMVAVNVVLAVICLAAAVIEARAYLRTRRMRTALLAAWCFFVGALNAYTTVAQVRCDHRCVAAGYREGEPHGRRNCLCDDETVLVEVQWARPWP